MMRRVFISLLLMLLAPLAAACDGPEECADGLVFRHFRSDGPMGHIMAVFLHGDVSSGRAADYMLSSAQRFARDTPGAHAVVVLRPGYADRYGRQSEGSDCGRRDCYTRPVVEAVAKAVADIGKRFGARDLYALGHSGGAAILGSLLGLHPELLKGAVLVSCPCDVRAWKPSWSASLSPIERVGQVPRHVTVLTVTGRDDSNTPPVLARRYVDALNARGGAGAEIVIEGTHDYRSVRDAGLRGLLDMLRR